MFLKSWLRINGRLTFCVTSYVVKITDKVSRLFSEGGSLRELFCHRNSKEKYFLYFNRSKTESFRNINIVVLVTLAYNKLQFISLFLLFFNCLSFQHFQFGAKKTLL